jgi:hypothetical protein
MLRPFVKQDAILGHVASRGDRNPRALNKAGTDGFCQRIQVVRPELEPNDGVIAPVVAC